jgi:hypothetical protein
MTNYPNSQDNNITLPGVSGATEEDVAINALREAAFAIEKELGITPSGIYSDVRARFDILEARINNPVSPTILSDGYVNSPLFIVNTPDSVTLSISDGYGVPTESRIDGSLYMRSDGYANNELYIRRSGAWFPVQSDVWIAGGDLSGTYNNQTVIGIRGKPLNASLASVGATQDGYHLTWNNAGPYWEAQTGFIAAGDLAPLSGPFGRVSQTVVRLQNRNVSAAAPSGSTASDGDGLAWDPIASQWQPRPRAVIFDGYVGRSNLRSNKILQSPIDNTKVGIVNFGSRSSGATAGATNDYSAILSGDRNTVTGNFGVIAGGDSNIVGGQYASILGGVSGQATAQYSVVLGGNNNLASATHAFVANGNTSTASANQSFVLDGYSNTASAINAFILNGGNNQANATFSGVLNGISNVITLGATHSGIGWGASNTIAAAGIYSIILGGSGNSVSGANSLVGSATNGNIQSNYSTILSGLGNTVSAASPFSFIGTGSGITVTGAFATILNAATSTVNGLHTLVLNGNTNAVTGTYSTIINGNNNTISGSAAYATIGDGYSNTVSSSGGVVVDGYSNTVSGIWSSILNGNSNSIAGRNSTILNGSSNTMDATSLENTLLFGTTNSLTGTSRAIVGGHGNTLLNVASGYVLGNFNNTQSSNSSITGNSNIISSGGNMNRVFGDLNNLGTNSTNNNIFGSSNALVNTVNGSTVIGASNTVDGYNNGTIIGNTNTSNSNFGLVTGQFGRARMYGQRVHATSRFTVGTTGQAQWSRLVLTGNSNAGAAIPLLLQDGSPTPITFADGFSYDLQIRVMVVNISPIGPNPVVPARFVFDVLAHQESGNIVVDNINHTVITPNTSDDPTGATRTIGWSVSITTSGNQLQITVDPELSSANYVQPGNTPSNRRAVATVEMREITRL